MGTIITGNFRRDPARNQVTPEKLEGRINAGNSRDQLALGAQEMENRTRALDLMGRFGKELSLLDPLDKIVN